MYVCKKCKHFSSNLAEFHAVLMLHTTSGKFEYSCRRPAIEASDFFPGGMCQGAIEYAGNAEEYVNALA